MLVFGNLYTDTTMSKSESNIKAIKRVMRLNPTINIAVVFQYAIPEMFLGRPVINGDTHDLRFLDTKGVIVGLTAKGDAKKDQSGFTVLQEKPEKIKKSA